MSDSLFDQWGRFKALTWFDRIDALGGDVPVAAAAGFDGKIKEVWPVGVGVGVDKGDFTFREVFNLWTENIFDN